MGRYIDFIRHGNAVFPEGRADDRHRILSPLGIKQAQSFALARCQANEDYEHVIISDVDRSVDTGQHIMNVLGTGCRLHIVPEMFDPEEWDRYALKRNNIYSMLGAAPLFRYHDMATIAMVDLGIQASVKLKPIFQEHRQENILVIGHGVYTNEIILDTFMRDLPYTMRDRLLQDAPLSECAGYRLVFDDGGNLKNMLDLQPPLVAAN
jgi:broad specificity phosphatase PhoE